jgi:probable HAF family extracellular repeat protein
MRSRHTVASVVVLLVVAAIQPIPRTQTVVPVPYVIRDLGSLGGGVTVASNVTPASIGGDYDDIAYVAGYSRTAGGTNHAVVYHQGQLQDLGTLGGDVSVATAVNVGGEAIGRSTNSAGVVRAFLYQDGAMRDLGSLSGTGQSFATAFNFSAIVGGSQTTSSIDSTQAFIYRDGVMQRLGATLGGTKSLAYDINGSGQVVGYAYTRGNASYHAFLFSDGVTTDLGTLGGSSEARALNDNGDVVGRSRLAGSSIRHAFLYSNGSMRDLGTLGGNNSLALDINAEGSVVGKAQIAGSAAYHAFLWRHGTMTDLNTLLPGGSGWVLQSAKSINNGGQIVGYGTLNGETRAFVLSPPPDLALSTIGFEDFASNLPRPVQAGRQVTWALWVLNRTVDGTDATNVTVTDTLTGPVEYVRADVIRGDGSCQINGGTLECRFAKIGGDYDAAFVITHVRSTAAGPFGHTARITHTDQADPNAENNELSESNLAISLAGITLTPTSVTGGKPSLTSLTLTAPHPHSAVIRLRSSNPEVVPVRDTYAVVGLTHAFNIIPAVVSVPTTVQISATYGLVTKTATLTVLPTVLASFHFARTTVIGGCDTFVAKVTLTGAAPPSGAVVGISEGIAAAQFPSALVVPGGEIIHKFRISTSYVTASQSGAVTATYAGVQRREALIVRPIRARTLILSPNPVVGGNKTSGLVTLECPAAPGPITVFLTSGNSAIAAPTVPVITIPAGGLTGPFVVGTSPVSAPTAVSIHARVFGIRKTTSLAINP